MQHDNPDETSSTSLTCPVPTNQQPVYQYRILKDRKFFRWAVLNDSIYTSKLLSIWAIGLLLSLYATTVSSAMYSITVSNLLWGAIAGNIAVILCVLKLYAVWYCVHSNLMNQKIVYEIAKLRKTAVWQKPELMAMRDWLIARFQIRPILQRLQRTILLLFFSFNLLVFLLINS